MPRLKTQLSQKCTNKECCKIFCRQIKDKELELKIVEILNKYGKSLNCKKIMKTDFSWAKKKVFNILKVNEILKKDQQSIWIDSLIYVYSVIQEPKEVKTLPSIFSFKILKNITISEKSKNTKPEFTDQVNKIKPCQELQHKFCSLMKKELDDVECYLLVGVIHFLLKKFQKCPDFNLGILIIRYFNILGLSGTDQSLNCINTGISKYFLETEYFPILLKVIEVLCNKIINSVIPLSLTDHKNCSNGNCLLYFTLSKVDFENTIKVLVNLIDTNSEIDYREDEKLSSLFKSLQELYNLNIKIKEINKEQSENRMGSVNEKSFLLNSYFSKINLKNELKLLRLKCNSPLNHFFSVPLQIKADLLRIQNCDQMKSSLQESFFRALFEGITEPYLFINIRRDRIYKDTLKIIAELETCEVHKQLKVEFKDEIGIDSGGIKNEFFSILGHEIENDILLFTHTNNRIWFRNGANLQMIESIGKLVGIALYNDVVLNVPFPSILFKKLLKTPVVYSDLEEIEPEIYNSLKKLENCTDEDLIFLEQDFTIDYEIDGEVRNCELVTNGRNIKVDKSNLNDFILCYFKFIVECAVEEEFKAFSRGFYSIVDYDLIRGLTSMEFERLILGSDEINYEIIKTNTIYTGYTVDHPTIGYFWQFFSELTHQRKRKLIQFITGNDRLPVGGSKCLKLEIKNNGSDTERLPSSQTCFNILLLPEYSSYEKIKLKMKQAIDMTAGFFLV